MSSVAIVTDSAASLPPDLVSRYGIQVVPHCLYWCGQTYRDGVDLSASQLYQRLRVDSRQLPSSSAPSVGDFLKVFARLGREAGAILSIHLSADLSATFNIARHACALLEDMPIKVIDSRTGTMGCGFVVLAAARAAAQGADLPEIMSAVQTVIQRVHVYAVLDSLSYVHRSGRVPAIASIASSLLDIHPLLYIQDGHAGLAGVQRTKRRAVRRLLDLVEEKAAGRPIRAAVMHADAPEEAAALRQALASRCACCELLTSEFTPVMGAHAGPGLVGVAFYPDVE